MLKSIHLALIIHIVSGAAYAQNFIVYSRSDAQELAIAAEHYRSELAKRWFEKELSNWDEPCTIKVTPAAKASGITSFLMKDGVPFDWRVEAHGSHKEILESIIPHEVTHLVLTSHFRSQPPKWLDEGLACTLESADSKAKLDDLAKASYLNGSFLPIIDMMQITQYPDDQNKVISFYAQCYSVVKFLISKRDERHLVECISIANQKGWTRTLEDQYGYDEITLERDWLRTFNRFDRTEAR